MRTFLKYLNFKLQIQDRTDNYQLDYFLRYKLKFIY